MKINQKLFFYTVSGVKRVLTCAAIAAVLGQFSAKAITVPNFGFEEPKLAQGEYPNHPEGATWTFEGGGAGICINSGPFRGSEPAPEGVQAAYIQGVGSISQTVSGFVVGNTYTITYSAAMRDNDYGGEGQTWFIKLDGAEIGAYSLGKWDRRYITFTATFTASATSHQIKFDADNVNDPSGDNAVIIDNVRITDDSITKPVACDSLTAASLVTGTVQLDWTASSPGFTGFKIARRVGENGNFVQIAIVGAEALTYTDTKLFPGTTYYYQVRAANDGGDSDPVTANATVIFPPVYPLPNEWSKADVGGPSIPGSASYQNSTFTVSGSGADLWADSDQFYFVYQPWTGDVEITARLVSVESAHEWAKAGVMVRGSLDGNAKHAMMLLTPVKSAYFLHRDEVSGGSAQTEAGRTDPPCWLRVVRRGNTLTGYKSTDGVAWQGIDSFNITMESTAYVGLAMMSHNNSALGVATFDNVLVRQAPPLQPTDPLKIALSEDKTKLVLTWNPAIDGQCSIVSSTDVTKPLSEWTEVTSVATQGGVMTTEIALPSTPTFFRVKMN